MPAGFLEGGEYESQRMAHAGRRFAGGKRGGRSTTGTGAGSEPAASAGAVSAEEHAARSGDPRATRAFPRDRFPYAHHQRRPRRSEPDPAQHGSRELRGGDGSEEYSNDGEPYGRIRQRPAGRGGEAARGA